MAGFLRQDSDALNSLGIALMLLCFLNPFAAGNIGLQLSFFATLGILVLNAPLYAYITKPLKRSRKAVVSLPLKAIAGSGSVALSAVVFTMPSNFLYLSSFSTVSLPANLLAVYPATIAMICAGLCALFAQAGPLNFLAYLVAFVSGLCSKFILSVARLMSSFSLSSIGTGAAYLKIGLAGCLLMAAFCVLVYQIKGRKMLRFAALTSVFVLAAGFMGHTLIYAGVTKLSVIDTGNASAVLISKNGKNVLLGCGGDTFSASSIRRTMTRYSTKKLKALILPRNSQTESGALPFLADELLLEEVYAAQPGDVLAPLALKNKILFGGSARFSPWPNTQISYLSSPTCCAAFAQIDSKCILFIFYPGSDIGEIPSQWLEADILVCRAQPPETLNLERYDCILISSDSTSGAQLTAAKTTKPVYATAGEGSLLCAVSNNSGISINREP